MGKVVILVFATKFNSCTGVVCNSYKKSLTNMGDQAVYLITCSVCVCAEMEIMLVMIMTNRFLYFIICVLVAVEMLVTGHSHSFFTASYYCMMVVQTIRNPLQNLIFCSIPFFNAHIPPSPPTFFLVFFLF